MALVIFIQLAVVGGLIWITLTRGLERALPFYTFTIVLVPEACQIQIPGVFVLTIQRTALITLVILFLVLGKRSDASKLPLRWLILAHVGWAIVSTAGSVVLLDSVKKLIAMVIEYYILYYVFSRTITSTQTIKKIVFAIVAAVGVASLIGAFESYTTWRVTDWFPVPDMRFNFMGDGMEGRGNRIESTFAHPILFGAAIAMAIPMALHLLNEARSRSRKLVLWVSLLLMFLCLYKTSSRGPWLAAMLSFVLVFPFCGRKVRKYMLAICFLCATVLIVRPGVWDTIVDIYQATEDPTQPMGASYEYRYALYHVATEALGRSPGRALWGYGLESFSYLQLRGPFLGKPDHLFVSCDSAWTELAIETGYVGLFLIAFLLLKAAWRTLKDAFKLPRPENRLSWVFVVNMVAFYFMMMSVAMYAWGQNGDMLWIGIASSLVYGRLVRAEQAEQKRSLPEPLPEEEFEHEPGYVDAVAALPPALLGGV